MRSPPRFPISRPSAITSMHEPRLMTAGQAICEATDLAMAADPRVVLMGEGVADPKAIFGTAAQLADKYGRQRVIEMPLSENGFTGIAIGAAMNGLRPIIVHQRVEFCLLAMEQLVNNAAKVPRTPRAWKRYSPTFPD
jgi:pyruvate/2-oxoglutarate/acetoin dehydrogenase E1 component